jgi:DNA-binding SARP family transcriptional activator
VKEATEELKALVNREPFDEKKALKLIQLGAYIE